MKRKKRRYKWKIYTKTDRPYRSKRYLNFRRKVLMRDEWSCQWPKCKATIFRGDRIVVHHIKKWSTHPKLRFRTSNGIALCWTCHEKTLKKEEKYEKMFKEIVKSKS